jgi:hypothetical protein
VIRGKCLNVVLGYRELVLPAARWIDHDDSALNGGDAQSGWVGEKKGGVGSGWQLASRCDRWGMQRIDRGRSFLPGA